MSKQKLVIYSYSPIQSQCPVITLPAWLKETQGLKGGRLNTMK